MLVWLKWHYVDFDNMNIYNMWWGVSIIPNINAQTIILPRILETLHHVFHIFLAATKQLYECYFLSVCPSVHPSHLFDYVPIIASSWNFQELLLMAKVRSMQKVKVTEVKTEFNRFRSVTPVWIHTWWWNDSQSLMFLRRGALLFFKVICQISRSHHPQKFVDFDPNWAFPDCNSSLNSPMATKWCTKLEVA